MIIYFSVSDVKAIETEVCEHLRKVCRTLRSNRTRPELAIPAAQWESRLNERLAELELADPRKKEQEVAA